MNADFETLRAYVDALSRRNYGFVSHYRGDKVWRKGKYESVCIRNQKLENIIQSIREEYVYARKSGKLICEIYNLLDEVDDESRKMALLQQLSVLSDKALNACIKKGFNVPALYILGLADKDIKETDRYIKMIHSNYVMKNLYKDNGSSYMYQDPYSIGEVVDWTEKIEDCREMETNVEFLYEYILNGHLEEAFGRDYVDGLYERAEYIEASTKNSPLVRSLQMKKNLDERIQES